MSERVRSRPSGGHGAGGSAGPADARRRNGSSDRGARRPRQTTAVVEIDALRLAVHRPEEVADRLEEQLFTDPVHQAAFRALVTAPTLHEAIDGAEPEAAALLQRLAVEDASEDDVDVTTADLARAAAGREVARLAALKVSDDQLGDVSRRNGWLKLQMEALSDPEERVEACRRLVAWLSEQAEGE